MFLIQLLLGFVISYLGSITPSMLNITAVKISIDYNKKIAFRYVLGVSIVVIFQAFFALLFLKVILQNPLILETIEKASVFIFAILSIVFFRKAIQENQQIASEKSIKNGFLSGLGLSFINMFSIPFYAGIGAVFNNYNWLQLDIISITLFSFGSAFGTYLILDHYVLLAEKIKPKIAQFSKYLNYVLSLITGLVAFIALVKML